MEVKDIQRFNPDIKEGLSTAQVEQRRKEGLTNKTKVTVGKSLWEIIYSNVLSFFNIVLYIIGAALIVVGNYSSLFFIFVLLPNIIIGLVEDLYARHLMLKTRLITAPRAIVIRDGQEIEIPVDEIVLDDIVVLRDSNQISMDGEILSGSLSVNESLLTGESNLIHKEKGDKVLSGSFVVSGNAYVKAEQVGENSYIEKLSKSAKKFKRPASEILSSLKLLFKVISGFLVLSAAGMVITYAVQGRFNEISDAKLAVGSIAGSLISMVPIGLYLLTSAVLAVGVIKLSKKKVSVQEMYSIEMLARADVLCVDKTGTITDGTMSLKTIVSMSSEYNEESIKQIVSNLMNATSDSNATATALKKACNYQSTMTPTNVIPFASELKYSSVSFGTKGTYVIGAAEFINLKNKQGIIYRTEEYAKKGYRVITLAYSPVENKDKEKFEGESTCIALLVLEDNIKDSALSTFRWFRENGVDIIVISGDNAVTVSEVAKSVGIPNADKYCSLDGVSDEKLRLIATNFTVFGRAKPEQKQIIIEQYKKAGKSVAMTGDGVNDILALKIADCSIAMASGSEATRNTAHMVITDNDFAHLPDAVAEGRRVINNVQRTAGLYLTKTLFAIFFTLSFLVLSWVDTKFTYPFVVNNMYIWELFAIGISSFFVALQPNSTKIEGKFFKNVARKVFPTTILTLLPVIVFFILYLFRTPLRDSGFMQIGFSNEIAADGTSIGYYQFIAMSFTAISLLPCLVLLRICWPLDKYRGLVVIGASVATIIAIALEIIFSYRNADPRKFIFASGTGYLTVELWLLTIAVIVICAALYMFVTFLIEALKKRRDENAKN